MSLITGTSGFSYTAWKGKWYPEELSGDAMLGYYAKRFPAVEINGSFYRMPDVTSLRKWAEQVPKTFQFAFKAPGAITHRKWNAGTSNLIDRFLTVTEVLALQRGPLLFQFPPYLKKDDSLLDTLLPLLLKGVRVALEFRHVSWFKKEVFERLRAHGACLVYNDTDVDEMPFVSTASWGYCRLRRADYTMPALKKILKLCAKQDWNDVYVFFKHEDEARGPILAERLMAVQR